MEHEITTIIGCQFLIGNVRLAAADFKSVVGHADSVNSS